LFVAMVNWKGVALLQVGQRTPRCPGGLKPGSVELTAIQVQATGALEAESELAGAQGTWR